MDGPDRPDALVAAALRVERRHRRAPV